jgi:predicted hotdog family 3-hydroxylacyl-ACP dehydratase
MSAMPPVGELVPHASRMRLIDRVVAENGETVRSEATIRSDNIFFRPGCGVPAYVGFELMAQTISAYDGLRRRRDGRSPAIGLLLGCRSYRTARPFFAEGERLCIEATSVLEGANGMASFECRITGPNDEELATAVINVFRPSDHAAFLQAARP